MGVARQPCRPGVGARPAAEADIGALLEIGEAVGHHHRPDLFGEQAPDLPGLGHGEVEAADGEVDALAREIDRTAADRKMQGDRGMGRLEAAQARDQPAHRHRGLAGQHQGIVLRRRGAQALHGAAQFAEETVHRQEQRLARRRQLEAAAALFEQPKAQIIREFGDAPADCAMRQCQRVGG